ncbi:hypothetical protein ACFL6U_06085 [Planctomycetota bacterium]
MTKRRLETTCSKPVLLLSLLVWCVVIVPSGCRSHVDNKVLSQSTLYAFHFTEDTSQLNTVGRYDLDVLLLRFKGYSGKLYVQKGDATSELYGERIESVVNALERAGVDESRIEIKDVTAKGKRPLGERVIVIMPEDEDEVGTRR